MDLSDVVGIGKLIEFGTRLLKKITSAIREWRQSRHQDKDAQQQLRVLLMGMRVDCEDALSDHDWTSCNRKLAQLVKSPRVRKIQALARDLNGGFRDLHTRTREIETLRSTHQSQAADLSQGRTGGDFPRRDLSDALTKLNTKLTELREYIDTEMSKLPKEKKWA